MPPLFQELPYAFVISTSKKNQVCHECCKSPSTSLRRCSGCRFAHYCNESCQKSAWKDHASECVRLKKVNPKIPTDTARLMARIIAKLNADSISSTEPSGARTFQMLMSHVNEIQNDSLRMEHFTYVCAMLKQCFDDEPLPPVPELLAIFGKICINSFSLTGYDGDTIGVGLYLELSVLDHSCSPDAVVVFDGPKAVINCIREDPIADYTTARISYVDLLNSSAERKRQLKEQYYFECACSLCKDPLQDQLMEALKCPDKDCDGCVLLTTGDGDAGTCEKCNRSINDVNSGVTMMQRIRWQLEKLDSLHKEQDFSSIYDHATELLREAEYALHPVNVYYIRLLDHAFDAALQLEKWPPAVELGQAALPGYRVHYPRGHPSVTNRLAQIGKILQYLVRLEEAECYLQQAHNEAKLSHGEQHPLFGAISEMLFTCREERRAQLSKEQITA